MIIKSIVDFEIGKIFDKGGVTDKDGVAHIMPFFVIREATRDEYLNYCKGLNCPPGNIWNNDRFFEISID